MSNRPSSAAALSRSPMLGWAGEPGPCRDITLINAGAALWVAGAAADLKGGLAVARDSVDSGAARERLMRLVEATNAAD